MACKWLGIFIYGVWKNYAQKGVRIRDLTDFEILFSAITASKNGLRRQP